MVYTTSNPDRSNPSGRSHEWFEELCAVSAIGELSASEYAELQSHLATCEPCRMMHADFCKLSSEGLSYLAAGSERVSADAAGIDEDGLLQRCLNTAHNQVAATSVQVVTTASRVRWISRVLLTFSSVFAWQRWAPVAATVLIAAIVGLMTYEYRDRQAKAETAKLQQEAAVSANNTQRAEALGKQSAAQLSTHLSQANTERQQLQSKLSEAEAKYLELTTKAGALEKSLTLANSQNEQVQRQLKRSAAQHQEDVTARLQLQNDLRQAQEQLGQQQQLVAELNTKLQGFEAEKKSDVGETTAVAETRDEDVRRLFGARDLHIVDVYDVGGNGNNTRTYGRVYYVEKKLLVFYAFDLQDRKHNRVAAAFQAWGYQQASPGKPHNLGLFYVDDSTSNRWVLKVDNPRVLERIDAVFVTLEPPKGSATPRGRRLLYANLGGPPNHP